MLASADVHHVDTELAPPQTYLGVLGSTGLTAYVGLMEIARTKPGDVVFVSGAAGAVGSVAGQIARLLGAERVAWFDGRPGEGLRAWSRADGFDAAIDYRRGGLPALLAEAAPHGIDVYCRQRRRRPPPGGHRCDEPLRPYRPLRGDLPVQRARAHPGPRQPRPGHRQAPHPPRHDHRRPPGHGPAVRAPGRGLAPQRLPAGRRNRRRRHRQRRGRVPVPDAGGNMGKMLACT
ncbi:hypothetical protein ACU686_26990 [Yinghuangia aomiensis]